MTDYEKLLLLCENSLLHLYCHVGLTRAYTSPALRNEILVKYLKPKIKMPEHKSIKKDIQLLVRVGRNKKMKLETKILTLKKLTLDVINSNDY